MRRQSLATMMTVSLAKLRRLSMPLRIPPLHAISFALCLLRLAVCSRIPRLAPRATSLHLAAIPTVVLFRQCWVLIRSADPWMDSSRVQMHSGATLQAGDPMCVIQLIVILILACVPRRHKDLFVRVVIIVSMVIQTQ
jgi:hypothetical protein